MFPTIYDSPSDPERITYTYWFMKKLKKEILLFIIVSFLKIFN
jgi:hypothetical protein